MNVDNLTVEQLSDPGWYLHKFNFPEQKAIFIHLDRNGYAQSSFLDDRVHAQPQTAVSISLPQLTEWIESTLIITKPVQYIFHTAYCCSTLMSRALDVPGSSLAYREPVALHQLAATRRRHWGAFTENEKQHWRTLFNVTVSLLSRSYAGEIPIIKPTDSCNNLISLLLDRSKDSSAVLLDSSLPAFLVSTLKLPGRRDFNRGLLQRANLDAQRYPNLRSVDTRGLSDGRAAAFVWATQMQSYLEALDQGGNTYPLDSNVFLSRKDDVLARLNQLFRINLDDTILHSIAQGPVFSRHAKSQASETFNADSRQKETNAVKLEYKDEIDDAVEWCASIVPTEPITEQQSQALMNQPFTV